MAFSACVHISPFRVDTGRIGLRAHPTPVWPHLMNSFYLQRPDFRNVLSEVLEGRTWTYLPGGHTSTGSGASVTPEEPLCRQGHVWRAPGGGVDHYSALPMIPLLELTAPWQPTPAQGGMSHCHHSMSCLCFTVSDLLGQICVI